MEALPSLISALLNLVKAAATNPTIMKVGAALVGFMFVKMMVMGVIAAAKAALFQVVVAKLTKMMTGGVDKAAKKASKAVKKVAKKVGKAVKKAAKSVKKVAKKIGKAITSGVRCIKNVKKCIKKKLAEFLIKKLLPKIIKKVQHLTHPTRATKGVGHGQPNWSPRARAPREADT